MNIEDSSSFDLLADSQGTFIASISLNTFSEVMCTGDVNDVEIDLELVPLSSMIEWIKRYKKSIMRIIETNSYVKNSSGEMKISPLLT